MLTIWCFFVKRRQALAFVLVVLLALVGTVKYENDRQSRLQAEVKTEVRVLTKSLSSPVPGTQIHVHVVKHPDGSYTVMQDITRSIFVPGTFTH